MSSTPTHQLHVLGDGAPASRPQAPASAAPKTAAGKRLRLTELTDRRPAVTVPSRALEAVPATGRSGMVELLWHDRRVSTFGQAHRISIPIAAGDVSPQLAAIVGSTLHHWWTSRPAALSNCTDVTSVSVELDEAPLRPSELVMTITTSSPATEAQVANMRTIRDLRRALRNARLSHGGASTAARLALVGA